MMVYLVYWNGRKYWCHGIQKYGKSLIGTLISTGKEFHMSLEKLTKIKVYTPSNIQHKGFYAMYTRGTTYYVYYDQFTKNEDTVSFKTIYNKYFTLNINEIKRIVTYQFLDDVNVNLYKN